MSKSIWHFNSASHCWELFGTEVARQMRVRPIHAIYGIFNEDGSHCFRLDWDRNFSTLAEAKAAAMRWLVGDVVG